jgi:hypothetical protein
LYSEGFAACARTNPRDFTRDRALPLPALVALLVNLRKGTVQDELDQFVEVLTEGLAMHALSASAFCQARQKLQARALMRLSDHLVATFQARFAWRRWHGRRLLAVDGSTVRLPPSPDVVATFGPPPEGSRIPLGRVSVLYDVLNAVVVEAELVATDVGERVLAGEHLAATGADDLVLYDRGYPAFWLFALHALEQRDFCMRVPVAFSKEVEAFVASGAPTATVVFTPGPEARRQCEVYRLPSAPLHVRLVRVTLAGGESEVLATSLLDEAAFPTHVFKELYHLRWCVEEQYKRAKCRVEIENFSGRSALSVLQDFYAKIFTMNLTAILVWVAQAIADRLYAARRLPYRVNFANALSKMKHAVARLLLGLGGQELVTTLVLAMAASVEAVRPDRSAPRNMKPAKAQGFHSNYKRCR